MRTKYVIKKITTSLPFSNTEEIDEFCICEQMLDDNGEIICESNDPITMSASTLLELQMLIEGSICAMSDIAKEASQMGTSELIANICKSCLKLKEGMCVGDDVVICSNYREVKEDE